MNDVSSLTMMSLALQLAERGRLTVSPNPMVGCVIVNDGEIVGQGYHERRGEAHAEIIALKAAGNRAKGATLYVTLEPCCHHGKTPPCTEVLIKAGIKKVVMACRDPNPRVNGKGLRELSNAGIEIECGVLEEEAKRLNKIFFHYMIHQKPYVIAKWAMSLDGKTSVNPGDDRALSGKETAVVVHDLRQQVDAILIGAGTACKDDPQLTARSTTGSTQGLKQPTRIILSRSGELPLHLKIFDPDLPGKTLIGTTECKACDHYQSLTPEKVEVLVIPKDNQGNVSIPHLLEELGKREISSLLVEGGMTVHHRFLEAGAVNQWMVIVSPTLIGTLNQKQRIESLSIKTFGEDICLTTI